MGMYGYVGLCMAMYGYVWLCMAINLGLCMAVYGYCPVLASLSTNFFLGEIIHIVSNRRWGGIRILKRIVGLEHLINAYSSIVEPYFTYCCIVWDWRSIGETLVDSLEKLQNRAARVITGASYSKHSADIRQKLGWLSLSEMRQHHMVLIAIHSHT